MGKSLLDGLFLRNSYRQDDLNSVGGMSQPLLQSRPTDKDPQLQPSDKDRMRIYHQSTKSTISQLAINQKSDSVGAAPNLLMQSEIRKTIELE